MYWLDTRPGTIYRLELSTGKRTSWPTPSRLGALGLCRGGLVVATKTGIGFLDTRTGAFDPIVDPEASITDSRINDAKMDRAGRFWFGSCQDDGKTPTGTIYRFGPQRTTVAIARNYTIPNGFAWSLDNTRMYLTDTALGTIFVYDFDLGSGTATNRRPFAYVDRSEGTPDGTTVDSEDYVWSARFGGGAVARYAPDGRLDRVIELPTKGTTNVAFGGDDLRTLFVTSGARGLSEHELAAQPLAGAVFALRVDVPGVPETMFAA